MAPRPVAAPAAAPSFAGGMQMQPLPPAMPGAPPGMQGMQQPGMQQPGMGPPMGHPGMGQPGMQPGMGPPPGMGHPGMQQPGMGHPGMAPQGMGHPGMQQGYPPAFQPPPAMQQQVQAPMMGPPPVSGGVVGPPALIGGPVAGMGVMPPAPPPMIAPPPIMAPSFGAPGGMAPPPPVVPSPVGMGQAAALPASPGVLSGPSAQAGTGKSGVLVGFLVTFQNEPSGAFWPIHSGRTQIGRAGSDKVEVGINDASASSRHASVHADPSTGQAYVEDEGSRNGTFLNERKLTPGEQRQLHDNDRLRLGSTTLVVKLLVS